MEDNRIGLELNAELVEELINDTPVPRGYGDLARCTENRFTFRVDVRDIDYEINDDNTVTLKFPSNEVKGLITKFERNLK